MADKLECIGGVCGSGKSKNIIAHILANHTNQKFLIALPTLIMVNQTIDNIKHTARRESINVDLISHIASTNSENVLDLLQAFLLDGKNGCAVITHKALEMLAKRLLIGDLDADYLAALKECLSETKVFCDENPQPLLMADCEFNVDEVHQWEEAIVEREPLGKYVRAIWEINKSPKLDEAGNVSSFDKEGNPIPDKKYRKILKTIAASQAYEEKASNIAYILLSEKWIFKTDTEKKGERYYRLIGFTASPLIYILKLVKNFYLMAANAFTCPFTVVAKEWGFRGTKFDAVAAEEQLWPDAHRLDHPVNIQRNVTVHYLLDARASMSKLSNVWDQILHHVNRLMKHKDFIFATNSDKATRAFKTETLNYFRIHAKHHAFNIPYVSNGLNIFGGEEVHGNIIGSDTYGMNEDQIKSGMCNAVWLGVSRLNGDVTRMINNKAICDAMEVHNSHEAAYQMVCRTAFRDQPGDPNKQYHFVFIDKETRDYFLTYAPEAKLGEGNLIHVETTTDKNTEIYLQQIRRIKAEYPGIKVSQARTLVSKVKGGSLIVGEHPSLNTFKGYWSMV